MLTSILTGPDGNKYKVTHPEGASREEILSAFQQYQPQGRPSGAIDADDPFAVDVLKGLFAGGGQAAVSSAAGLTQWAGQTFQSEGMLEAAEDMRQYSQGIGENIGLDQNFRESFFGQVVQGLGQVPVTVGAGAAGLVLTGGNPLGMLGAAALTTGGQMTSEFLTDMEQTVGKQYTDFNSSEKEAALTGMLAQTALGTTLELAAVGKAVRPLLRRIKSGKGVSSKALKKAIEKDKSALREILESGAAEGFTEASQGQSLDTLASMLYDEDRELLTMDTLKRRSMEFGVGAIVGGTVSAGAQVLGSPGKTSTTNKDLGKPVEGRSEVSVPREIQVTYKPVDGPTTTVILAPDEGESAGDAAERILAGRYDPNAELLVTEVIEQTPIDVVLGEPDAEILKEDVPVEPTPTPAPEPSVETAPESAPDPTAGKTVSELAQDVGITEQNFRETYPDLSRRADERARSTEAEVDPSTGLPSFSLPQNLRKGQPGYYQTQNIKFASDLERAAYSATTSTRDETAKRKRAKYRKILQDAGYSSTEINQMGRELRSQMRDQYDGAGSELSVSLKEDAAPVAAVDELELTQEEIDIINQELDQELDPVAQAGDRLPSILDEKDITAKAFTPYRKEMMPKPEVVKAALPIFTKLKSGEKITTSESRQLASVIDRVNPVRPYKEVPPPASESDMLRGLEEGKREKINQARNLPTGTFVKLRLDIPAYRDHGVWVPTIHGATEKTRGFRGGKSISHQSTSVVTNAKFGIIGYDKPAGQVVATGIASKQETKVPIATILGQYVNLTEGQAVTRAEAAIKDPSFVQVGMDPKRRGYFYDRSSMQEVLSADEVIQVGPLVLAKNPVYGKTPRNEFLSREVEGAVDQDVVAQAAPAGPVSTEAAVERIELEQLAPEANEDFFQFWARVLDSTGTRFKPSSRNYGTVARKAVSDTLQFFKQNPKFATYYETDTKLTRQYVEEVVGPITESEFNLYRILVGLTSPSTKLADNVVDGLRVFKLYKDQGNFNFIVPAKTRTGQRSYDPEKTGFSFAAKTGAIKSTSILALQKKIDQLGLAGAVQYFLDPVTMKELVASKRSLGYKDVSGKTQIKEVVKQATGQDKLIPRMFMFGQKVGSYTMNTLGNVEYTTTDIWESRFIRSYFSGMLESGTGLPADVDEQKIFQDFSSAFNKEFEKQTGQKLEPASLQAVRWFYILNAFQRTGYQYAKTDDTISGYTAKAAQKLYGIDPTSGGQSISANASQVPAGNRLFSQPLQDATSVSERYQGTQGIRGQEPRQVVELDEERAAVIGKAYDKMKHDPKNPEVVRAYQALVKETLAQYDAILEDGYAIELSDVEYDNSQDMIEDVRNRKVMRVFSTEDGFGTEGITAKERRENPMLAESGLTDKNGKPLLVNDIFRFVHDFFGHGKLGNGFGPLGEENAWNVHSLMFSPLARRALTTETRGQNSWVNFSGVNDKSFEIRNQARQARADGDLKKAKRLAQKAYSSMRFAEQKIGLLPKEFSESNYQEDVTAQAAETAAEDRGPQETFSNINQLEDFISKSFSSIADKMGINIYPNMVGQFVAQYNVTQKIIEYNPRALLNRTKAGVQAAMREEIIHAAMHNVLIQKEKKARTGRSEDALWVDFFTALGNNLTPQERAEIQAVYQSLQEGNAVGFGSEYSRAVVQKFRYGDFTEQYIAVDKGGPAFQAIVELLRSVQAYMAKVLGPMVKTDPEAAQVIVDTVELLNTIDPAIRPKNQNVVANAYNATDKNTAEENTDPGESVDAKASERIREERKWFADSSLRKTASKFLTPVITRLNRINPMFGRLLQNLDTAIRERSFRYRKQTEPFFNRLNAIKGAEFEEIKQLLFFSPTPEEASRPRNKAKMQRRDALLHKYGLLNMYRLDVQPIMEEIYAEYTALGMPAMGYLEDYFPRVVKDLEGLIKSYGQKTKRTFELLVEEENKRRSKIKEDEGGPLPEMEKTELARFFQDFLQNKFRVDINGARLPGNVKVRDIQLIPADKLKFYDDPSIAFGKYTANMTRAIESFKVVGDTRKGRLQGKLGELTEELFSAGQIDQADAGTVKSLTELITTQFQTENEILKSLGTLTYMATLINPGPVLVQIMDLYKVALYRGLGGVVSGVYRTVTGNRRFDIEDDFSIAKTQLSAEFQDPSVLQKALDFGLSRLVPFRQMDTAMKHASIEAAYDDFAKKAKAPVGSKKYEQLLSELTITMGREDALKTIGDLKLGKAMESPLVKEALLAELLQRQPLTYLQVPEGYQTDPSKRLFYKLSTFMLLDLNYNRQEFMNDLGGPGKTLQQRTAALRRLTYMATLLTMFGLPSDLLDDWISGKDTYIPEHVMNNMLGMFGLSKYTTTRALEKGTVESVIQRFTPPAVNIIVKGEESLRSWVKGDVELFEMKAWRNSPLSDVWYNRTGAGKKQQEKLQKERRKEGVRPTFDR